MAREAGAARSTSLGRAAGPLPERLWHRHAGGERAGRAGRTDEEVAQASAQTGSSTRTSRTSSRPCVTRRPSIDGFDTSCFNGEYVTGDVSRAYLDALEIIRANAAKAKRDAKVRAEETDDDTMQVASGL